MQAVAVAWVAVVATIVPAQAVQIANPASEHCIKRGGKLIAGKNRNEGKYFCRLPNGKLVEEWTLFRRDSARQKT